MLTTTLQETRERRFRTPQSRAKPPDRPSVEAVAERVAAAQADLEQLQAATAPAGSVDPLPFAGNVGPSPLGANAVECLQAMRGPWLTGKELAGLFRTSERTIRRWAARGVIPRPKRMPGSRWVRWDRKEMVAFLKKLK